MYETFTYSYVTKSTLKTKFTWLMARLFGKKYVSTDESDRFSYEITSYHYKGCSYVYSSKVYAKEKKQ